MMNSERMTALVLIIALHIDDASNILSSHGDNINRRNVERGEDGGINLQADSREIYPE
jgi:hypothetical protein